MKPLSVFLTGAAGGLGVAIAKRLVDDGHHLIVTDLDRAKAEALALALGSNAYALGLDVRQSMGWERAAGEAWELAGGIDVLINNAGLARTGRAHRIAALEQARMLDVNVMGVIHGVQAFLPRFLERGEGHIVNVASLAAFVPMPGLATYAASKHAVRAYSIALGLELDATPVDVTVVYPAAMDTAMLEAQVEDDEAALSFGASTVSVEAVAAAVAKALVERPREILIPSLSGQALRFVGVLPNLLERLVSRLRPRGLAEQRRRRASRS